MRYILVLQWPGDSEADFKALISMEGRVDTALGRYASVDGHDFGSGEMNIFIETDRPTETFADAANALREGPRWGTGRYGMGSSTRFSGRRPKVLGREGLLRGPGPSFTRVPRCSPVNGKAVPISSLKPGEKLVATNTKTGKTQAGTIAAVLNKYKSGRTSVST